MRFSAPKALRGIGWLLLCAGCSNGGAQVVITLAAPRPGAVLTAADDASAARPGVQIDLAGSSRGVAHGTTLELFIDDARQAVTTKVEPDGAFHIAGVTLPPGTHRIYVQTVTGADASDEQQTYTLMALAISAPDNHAELSEDEDSKREGFQISVEVTAYALPLEQPITLQVDKKKVATALADERGIAVFEDVTLLSGSHTLLAYAGENTARIQSHEVRVDVVQKCAVTFIHPEPPAGGADLTLGGHDTCPADGEPFSTKLELSTDVGDGRVAKLTVNGQPVAMAKVKGSIVTFDHVELDKQSSANAIKVELETSNADSCVAEYPSPIFVDCDGPDCSITQPVPFEFIGPDDEHTLFLNRSMSNAGGDGFGVQVTTDAALAGHPVELIVDGNSLEPLTADAVADGDAATAAFDVALEERGHTLQAQCTDSAGNVTRSSKVIWVVDVTACGVAITDPAKGTELVPADDEDSASDGTQVVVTSNVEGDDCAMRRAAVCDPKTGIRDAPFLSYDGSSPLLSPITLDAHASTQNLCVEVQDRAGNLAGDHVAVSLRSAAPKLLIESPAEGAKFNIKGGNGYIEDADASSANACDATFSVACSELGELVELHHDSATGAVFGSAECKAKSGSDPALPDGYAGRAVLTAAFEDDDGSATIVATQTVTGSSSQAFVGASPARTIRGDCRPPLLQFADDPCGAAASNQLDTAQAGARDVSVLDTTGGIESAVLSFWNSDGTSEPSVPMSAAAGIADWTDLDLGGSGMLTLAVNATDGFRNSAQISCMATIVSDLPVLAAFTAPADGAVFNAGDTCDTGNPGELGVRVQAVADKQADRSALVQVNDSTVIGVAIAADGAIDVCVPVPDDADNTPPGPSSVVLQLSSTLSSGFARETRSVSVHGS